MHIYACIHYAHIHNTITHIHIPCTYTHSHIPSYTHTLLVHTSASCTYMFMSDTHMPAHICIQHAYHAHTYTMYIYAYTYTQMHHTHGIFFLIVKPCPRNVATQVSIPPMGSESSSGHLLGWISAMERKVMMVKLVWIWLSHMSLTVFVCACMPLSPREVRGQLRAVGALLPHCELKGWPQVFQLSHLPGPVVQHCFSGVLGMKLGVVHGGHLLLCPCWPLLYPSGVSLGHIWWRLFFLPSSGSCWPGTMQNQVGTSFL